MKMMMKMSNFENPTSPYLSRKSSEFHEILYADTNFIPGDGNLTKKSEIPKFKMADGRHIENYFWL